MERFAHSSSEGYEARRRGTSASFKSYLGLTLGVVLLAIAAWPALASAATFIPGTPPTFCTGTGSAAGQCEELKGVAVDQSNGHVYVLDANSTAAAGNFRVSEFNASGTFVKAFGVAVADGTTLAPQVCTTTCFAGKATGAAGAIGTGARGIAVDPETNIVYFVSGTAKVTYYNGTTGAFIGEFVAAGAPGAGQVVASPAAPQAFGAANGIGVDSTGAQNYLYVGTGNGTTIDYAVDKFTVPVAPATPPGYVCQITGKEVASATECHVTASKDGAFNGIAFTAGTAGSKGAAIAVDGSGNVFIAEDATRNVVSMFDSTGAFVKALSATTPVAVANAGAGNVLAVTEGTSEGGNTVKRINVSSGSVTGEVSLAAAASLGIAVDLSGLSSNGNVYVAEKTSKQLNKFVPVLSPTTVNKPVGTITSTTAALNGEVNNNNGQTGSSCSFQVTTAADTTFSSPVATVACVPTPVNGAVNTAVTGSATGLNPSTNYIYRVKATNEAGTSEGAPAIAFSTLAPPPTVTTTAGATSVTQTTAVVGGTVDPEGNNVTSCKVKYGTTTGYGSEVNCASLPGSGTSPVNVSADLSGLTAGTTYHFRVFATNGSGTSEGTDQTFATKPNVRTLTITNAGTGSGSVTCNGGACAASYDQGTKVTLAASPASDSEFKGWSGGGCSGTAACVVTISADTAVTATFDKKAVTPPPPPPPSCVVPKLAKKTLGQAKSALTAAHCTLGKVTKPKKAKGKLVVKSSKPGAGTTLANGAKVDLKLGPKPKGKKK